MSSLLSDVKSYGTKWEPVVGLENLMFDEEEKKAIQKIEVVSGDYGLNACFFTSDGNRDITKFIPMSPSANVVAGQKLDVNKVSITVLEKDGQRIKRVNY